MVTLPLEFSLTSTNKPSAIYHYCSLDTFIKIVERQALWLTCLDKMNDYAEATWLTHIIHNLSTKKLSNGTGNIDIFNALINQITACVNERLAYLTCFSEYGDRLSQWRGYADGGKGVAIGFKTWVLEQSMMKFFLAETLNTSGYSNGLAKVYYPDEKDLENWLSPLLDQLVAGADYTVIGRQLAEHAPIFKNPAFKEEGEWRIAVTPQRSGFVRHWRLVDQNLSTSLKFRPTEKGISSYFELPLEPEAISDIVLGPLNKSERDDIGAFLHARLGRNIGVCHSSATYCG